MQIALDKGEYDCARYLKTVQGIEHYFLSDSGTYCVLLILTCHIKEVPCLLCLLPPPFPQTPPPFYFHIIYLFLDPYLIMNHQNHPVDCGPSLLFSVPLPPSSFPHPRRPRGR